MKYRDLREFLAHLEARGQLKRVDEPVSPHLEMTILGDRVLRAGGPALWFQRPSSGDRPVLTNLFGTPQRVAWGMGADSVGALREVGEVLARLREPEPPKGLKDAGRLLELVKAVWQMRPQVVGRAPCQEEVLEGSDIDLSRWPIQHCWPDDIGPLLTWGLVITRGPHRTRQNLGIYRQQLIGPRRLIMRWLAHRGGALDFLAHRRVHPGTGFPICVALGADPATTLGAVTPVPDSLSEFQFAGLLRGSRTELAETSVGLQAPATAEMVLEGHIPPAAPGFRGESEMGVPVMERDGYLHALEGPFGDHTGYYNEQEWFPVFEVSRVTQRRGAFYHSTYTGKPPDEPAVLGVALNEVFVPLLQRQFTEIVDFYLPPEGCSYRMALVSIRKSYAGHAKRLMFGIWSYLRQFMYTKFIVVLDEDVNLRDWREVIWAITTRVDPARDTVLVDHTPIDYLDFASPVSGLGGKMGWDATNKWPGETQREWGRPIAVTPAQRERADALFERLFGGQEGKS